MSKILIFAGDDLVSSRKAFLEQIQSLRDKDFEVVRLQGKDITLESLELACSPNSLFGQKKALVIENLLSGQGSKEKNKIIQSIELLAQRSPDEDRDEIIFIWEGKDFPKAEQQKFGANFVFQNFKLPEVLFSFLERLSPGRAKENMSLFHLALQSVEPGFIFLMMARQVRLLLLAWEKETAGLPSWQVGKLSRQAKSFSREKLTAIYQRLLGIDFRQKTSQSAFSLSAELEFLLTEI